MTLLPIEALGLADIPEVMRIERLPGYDAFVARYEADEHAAQMASPSVRYFGLRDGAGLAGFVILQEVGSAWALLRRIAIATPGGGQGTRLFRYAVDWIFAEASTQALTLGVAHGNARAHHVYLREGLTQYGDDGIHHLMAVTRTRWAELHRR